MKRYDNLHELWGRAHVAGSPTKYVRDAAVFREIGKLNPGDTFDAGCGTGEYSIFLAKRGHKITAFDPSPFAIKTLLENGGAELGIDTQINTIEGFHTSREFDNVVSIEVIEHIQFDQAAVQKLYSLLKKGGTMVLSAPATSFLYGKGDRVSGHFRRYSRSALRKLVTRAGFIHVRIKSYGFPVLFVYSILRKIFLDKLLIRYFSTDISGGKNGNSLFGNLYPFMFAIDKLNMPFLGVGLVAICKK